MSEEYKPFILPGKAPAGLKSGKFRKGSKWDRIKFKSTQPKPNPPKKESK